MSEYSARIIHDDGRSACIPRGSVRLREAY